MTQPALIERITRSLAYMLRHQPEKFDLDLDHHGFGDLDEVVRALNERLGEPVEEEDVREAISSGDRPRYEIKGHKVRALYGHSIEVEPGEPSQPPENLYVAVSTRDAERALRFGLRGGRRRFLHLSLTSDDAREGGRRIGREYTVLEVDAIEAWEEGVNFFDRISLFLAEAIPTRHIEILENCDDGFATRDDDRGGRERSRGGRGSGRDRDRGGDRDGGGEGRGRSRRSSSSSRYDNDRPERDERDGGRDGDRDSGRDSGRDERPAREDRDEPRSERSSGREESGRGRGRGRSTRDRDAGDREPRDRDNRDDDRPARGRSEERDNDREGSFGSGMSERESGRGRSSSRDRDSEERSEAPSRGRGRGRGRDDDRSSRDSETSRSESRAPRGRSRDEERGGDRGGRPVRSSNRTEERAPAPKREEPAKAVVQEDNDAFGLGVFEEPKKAKPAPAPKPKRAPKPKVEKVVEAPAPEPDDDPFGAGL